MRRYFMLALLSSVVVHGAAAQSRLAKPTIDTVNHHIVRVMNNGPTAWADTNGWKLVYERTVQPPEATPGMLEKPAQIILLRDGRLIVSQRDPAQIRLYDAQGKFVRNIGHDGEGPGEYRAPKLALYHDTIVVHDPRLGRAALITTGGKFVRQFLTGIRHDGPPISVDDRGRLRVQDSRPSVAMFQPQWMYFDLNGKRLDSLLPPEAVNVKTWAAKLTGGGSVSYTVPFGAQNSYAFLRDGSILYGGGDRYEFLLTHSGRDTIRMFGRRGVIADPVPTAMRDSVFQHYASNPQLQGIGIAESDMPRTYPVWGEFALDGNGNVWVSVGRPAAKTYRFEVFNPSGSYLGTVAAPFDGLWRGSWTDDHVAVLDNDSDDLPRVRIFRIDRRGH